MNNEKRPLKQAIQKFYQHQSLSVEQLDDLQNRLQRSSAEVKKQARFRWLGFTATAMAASFLLVVVLGFYQTPALITSAYADIYKDANLNNGLQPSFRQWLSVNNIAAVPSQYPIKMSKFCRLGAIVTTHLRIAGKQQGEMNVFIYQGKGDTDWQPQWFGRSGRVDDINWKLLKVRDDLTVIVLYTQDMREKAVRHILGEMLPELEV